MEGLEYFKVVVEAIKEVLLALLKGPVIFKPLLRSTKNPKEFDTQLCCGIWYIIIAALVVDLLGLLLTSKFIVAPWVLGWSILLGLVFPIVSFFISLFAQR